ncbi:MAG: metal-sensitive transcriptional regulator [Chakrabartia sp.]
MGISIGARMTADKSGIVNRLKRIEGQVRGVSQMVADERYCIDIVHQIQAVKAALAKVEGALLKNHAACCVREAINSGDAQKQQIKFNELIDLFEQVKR